MHAPDLKNLSAKQALNYAKMISGLTNRQISDRSGVPLSSVEAYFYENDTRGYSPSLTILPDLCRALGNTILLDWLKTQLAEPEAAAKIPRVVDIFSSVNAVASDLGRLAEVTNVAAADGLITPNEARDIRGSAAAVREHAESVMDMLGYLAAQRMVGGKLVRVNVPNDEVV